MMDASFHHLPPSQHHPHQVHQVPGIVSQGAPSLQPPQPSYAGGGPAGGWSGMTIKEILEKVDLFNITLEEDSDNMKGEKVLVGKQVGKGNKTVVSSSDPESAFLGPKLWDKSIPLPPFDMTEFSIMNIDDFLNENNISLDDPLMGDASTKDASPEPDLVSNMDVDTTPMATSPTGSSPPMIGQDGALKQPTRQALGVAKKETSNDFLYAESKRAKAEREKDEKKHGMPLHVDFAPEDLALATVPGADFDPRRRAFSTEELKPQPIIRKRKKHYVPSESKDERYWEKRIKNNIAARRSREARRLKENQIALRAAYLEKENAALKLRIEEMRINNDRLLTEKRQLQDRLRKHEDSGVGP